MAFPRLSRHGRGGGGRGSLARRRIRRARPCGRDDLRDKPLRRGAVPQRRQAWPREQGDDFHLDRARRGATRIRRRWAGVRPDRRAGQAPRGARNGFRDRRLRRRAGAEVFAPHDLPSRRRRQPSGPRIRRGARQEPRIGALPPNERSVNAALDHPGDQRVPPNHRRRRLLSDRSRRTEDLRAGCDPHGSRARSRTTPC